jgi:hypothetical protein
MKLLPKEMTADFVGVATIDFLVENAIHSGDFSSY